MPNNFYGMYGNNPYFNPQQQMNNLISQHPQFFNQAMQNAAQPQQVMAQPQQQQQQQNISTQPPIMQPQNDVRNNTKMLYVGNREEAFVHPVDLVYSTPTFFYNRGLNEVYMKQYDGSTGNALFKIYTEQKQPQPQIEQKEVSTGSATIAIPNDNAYMNELKMIRAGIEGLYRYFNQPQYPIPQKSNKKDEIIDVDFIEEEIEDEPIKEKKGSKK